MKQRTLRLALVATTIAALAGCSNGDDDSSSGSTAPTGTGTATSTPEGGSVVPGGTVAPDGTAAPTDSAAPATTPTPEIVDVEGSVRDVIASRPELSNFSSAIDAWLAAAPGNEGVLRNPAGVTMFVPNNDAFGEDDAQQFIDDPASFTVVISEYLKVGPVKAADLGAEVSTAMGHTYPVGDGPSIGGVQIVESDIEATNGVVHVLDGQLVPPEG